LQRRHKKRIARFTLCPGGEVSFCHDFSGSHKWTANGALPAAIDFTARRVTAKIPQLASVYHTNLTDEDGFIVSTELSDC
jgi:hypothetical protein